MGVSGNFAEPPEINNEIYIILIMKSKFPLLIFALLSILSCSQNSKPNSKQIEGVYDFERGALIINADNTCFILAENTCIKGIVEIQDTIVKIKSYIPEVPFVLYGRKNSNYKKIMFQNFENADALVNYDANNNEMQYMRPLLNKDASCVDYQIEEHIENISNKFYFAIKGQKEVYEFENEEDYTDFIVQYIVPQNEKFEVVLEWNKKTNNLTFDGKMLEKNANTIQKIEIENIIAMYNRAYPETEYYYCNLAYNFFEEKGIDVHSGQYKKEENDGEYFYIDKYNEPPITHDDMNDTIDYREIDKEAEYRSTYQIKEYKKIAPTILKDKKYSINPNSIFGFSCDKEVI